MKPPSFNPAWSDEVRAVHRHDMEEIWDRALAPHVWNQYHNQLDTYFSYAGRAPQDILDVGCAQATLAMCLAEQGHRVTAVDLRDEFLSYARSRYTHGDIRFVRANVLEEGIDGQYDLVYANQIVEHLIYPQQLVAKLLATLRPGGRLVMTTPNGEYVRNTLPSYTELGDPAKWAHLQYSADADGHFYAYRAEELVRVFADAGARDVRVRYFETPLISGHMKVRHLHRVVPAAVLRLLDRALLSLPVARRKLAHQLLVTGIKPR